MDDALQLGLYAVLLLLRHKGQFEKTLEIILYSAFIWSLACAILAEWAFLHTRSPPMSQLWTAATDEDVTPLRVLTATAKTNSLFLLMVCIWSFGVAFASGWIRRRRGSPARRCRRPTPRPSSGP